MAQANSTNKQPILRFVYGDELQEMTWSKDPYRQDVKKDTSGFGEGKIIVVRISQSVGTTHVYARSLANKNPAAERRFTVPAKPVYHPYQLTGYFIRQAKGKPNSLMKGLEDEQRSAMRELNKRIDFMAWSNAGGSIGQIDAAVNLATNVLTFRNQRALFGQYFLGQKIVFSSDNGTGTSPAGLRGTGPDTPTVLTILSVDETLNRVTVGDVNGGPALLNSVPSITVNDFIFFDGSYTLAPSGKTAWNPVTAPTVGDSFFGVDRSVAVNYLSGWRVVGTGSMENTLIDAMVMGAQSESSMEQCYANMFDWGRLIKELGVKYNRQPSDRRQGVAGKGIEVYSPNGTTMVSGSNLVPQGSAWMGEPEADMQLSEGECPDILDEDGMGALRKVANDDAYQGDLGGYLNFCPNDDKNKMGPGGWTIISWPAAA